MNAKITLIVYFLISFSSFSQSYVELIEKYQDDMNNEFKDSTHSPLPIEDIKEFQGLDFYPINENYKITATFVKSKGEKFKMKTSTDRLPIYQRVGFLNFKIDEKDYKLSVYKNINLSKQKEFKDYLFIPFKDFTNGVETYGGGRYLDISKPNKKQTWVIDFNKAYNPYCAYSYKYSCPIPPEENHLQIEIKAGVKDYNHE